MSASKSWAMIVLTLIFVVLYAGVLLGWLKPLSDVTMILRLEPLIFVVIGYYFGRLPAQQNEQILREEISRQVVKADAAQHSREQTQQEREAIEERLKNVKTILMPATNRETIKLRAIGSVKSEGEDSLQILQHSVKTAVKILNS